jgi:hypothetical protein
MNARFGRPALSAEDAHVSPDGFNVDDILYSKILLTKPAKTTMLTDNLSLF